MSQEAYLWDISKSVKRAQGRLHVTHILGVNTRPHKLHFNKFVNLYIIFTPKKPTSSKQQSNFIRRNRCSDRISRPIVHVAACPWLAIASCSVLGVPISTRLPPNATNKSCSAYLTKPSQDTNRKLLSWQESKRTLWAQHSRSRFTKIVSVFDSRHLSVSPLQYVSIPPMSMP